MKLAPALGLMALTALPLAAAAAPAAMPGVERPERARQNYILKCQGCHGAEAHGDLSLTPPMAGMVARFLAVPGGRDYLARVPGVATAPVGDAELAELLNWTLYRFDAANVPPGFRPYQAAEMARLRKTPLRTDAAAARRSLVDEMTKGQPTGK